MDEYEQSWAYPPCVLGSLISEHDNRADRLALVHEIESVVDLLQLGTCVIIGSISIFPFMYQSTIFGTSVRPRAPPKAVPFQTRPVTS
jgi:hypothetical protein